MSRNIPTEAQWEEWLGDIEVVSAHKTFFGKSNDEVQVDFYRCVLERADELRFMPDEPFQYYILGFRDFILAGNFQLFDAADAASSFLKLVEYRLSKKPDSIKPICDELIPTVNYVSKNQKMFDADVDIYGDFCELKIKIELLIKGS
ncbi:hypothetical protein AB4140_13100 [Shewanella sp. 10N.286.51.B2]|uniref:hypothetical protein n=1 Tax=Shewanella sp. 10N.286.51.B2 TaxID=3229707 RepID=UPI003551B42B